jgi:hypothetical protein
MLLALVVAALVALVVVSSTTSSNQPAAAAAQSVALLRLQGESTAAFCGGLEHVPGVVESDVAVADLASTPRTLEVTITNSHGRHSLRAIAVRPGHVVRLDPGHQLPGSLEAVSVVANGGGVAATEAVRGVDGVAVAPCVTETAPTWWVTGGSTHRGSDFELSVFNAAASQTIVTISLDSPSSTGYVALKQFQDIVLNPYQLVGLSVHRVAPNAEPVSALVEASRGDVVVYGDERSTSGATTVSLQPGSPLLSTDTFVPILRSGTGLTTQLLLTNPNTTPVTASVRVGLALGCASCTSPFTESIAGDTTVPLNLAALSQYRGKGGHRIAAATTGGEVVSSSPGLIVLERVATFTTEGESAPLVDPTPLGADHLVLVDPIGSAFRDLGIVNPGATAVRVALSTVGVAGPEPLGRTVVVAAHGSLVVAGRELRGIVGGVLVLTATGPISAMGDVEGALVGSSLLDAVPAN